MITIDPNLRGCGVAVWHEGAALHGKLVYAEYVPNPRAKGRGYEVYRALAEKVAASTQYHHFWVIEMPVVYPKMPKTDLNDLLDVMGVGSAVSALCRATMVEHVMPSTWKGNLEKKKMLERIRSKLTAEELAVVQKTNADDTEDILDAIGIGLWKLGRLNTKVYPGAI